jgi:hypothetical protein
VDHDPIRAFPWWSFFLVLEREPFRRAVVYSAFTTDRTDWIQPTWSAQLAWRVLAQRDSLPDEVVRRHSAEL